MAAGGQDIERFDSRRLTGPNLYGRSSGAAICVRLPTGLDPSAFVLGWRAALQAGLERLGWTATLHERHWRELDGRAGLELWFSAAVDRLYAATELNDWAVARAAGEHAAGEPAAEDELERIADAAAREQAERRGVPELLAAADAHAVPYLLDDDELSLGYFDQCLRWRFGSDELPAPTSIDWARFAPRSLALNNPVALITGTNGKTTTTRLLARMARKHGLRVGNTSTDGLYVDELLVEEGDWTGPGGARAVLRNPAIDIALLEAARGGLLRRGVGVRSCKLAVITNIAKDHLGEYGIVDLDGLAAAKGVVATIVASDGRVVLGADSPALVAWARASSLPAPIVWFSLDPQHPVLLDARAQGHEVWTVQDGMIARGEGQLDTRLCAVEQLPMSLGGLARHNVANALAAAAAARVLGFCDETIVAALREFGAQPDDNPGRARLWTLERPGRAPVRVLLDFAHNLAGIEAMTPVVRGLRSAAGPGPIVCFGMAGDRSDDDLRSLAAALLELDPWRVILREKPAYARGRDPGEVPRVLEQGLRAAGYSSIAHAIDEPGSLELALAQLDEQPAGPDPDHGGSIVVLVHTERERVDAWLRDHGARPG